MKFKLWLENAPVIVAKRDEYDTLPYIDMYFPTNGSMWRYVFPDQYTLDTYLGKFGRNKGRLVARIKSDPRIEAKKMR